MPRPFFIIPLVALTLAACTESTPTEATPAAVVATPAFGALTGGTPNTNAANGLANATYRGARGCLDGSASFPDGKLIAPVNTKDNAAQYTSTNGSCTGDVVDTPTIWNAPASTNANNRCETEYTPARTPLRLKYLYPDVPEDWYVCPRA